MVTLFIFAVCFLQVAFRTAHSQTSGLHVILANGGRYVVEEVQRGSQSEGGAICRAKYGGKLALIPDQSTLDAIEQDLEDGTRNYGGEMWLAGRTNVSNHRSISTISTMVGAKGSNCVIISNWLNGGFHGTSWRLFAKTCTSQKRSLLCELPKKASAIYMPLAGEDCPTSSIKTVDVNMTAPSSDCTNLGGTPGGASQGNQTGQLCSVQWCYGNFSTDSALVAAKRGKCAAGSSQGGLRTFKQHCVELGGTVADPDMSSWQWTECQLDWCNHTVDGVNAEMYVPSPVGGCEGEARIAPGQVSMANDDCLLLGGEVVLNDAGTGPSWQGCHLDWCRLTVGKNCKNTAPGDQYTGDLAMTLSGKFCQRWDQQSPHQHADTDASRFPDRSLSSAADFCRNPSENVEGPWCHTTDPQVPMESCDVPFCEGAGARDLRFKLGKTEYTIVRSQHEDPKNYCELKYSGTLALLETPGEVSTVGALAALALGDREDKGPAVSEILVGGRTSEPANKKITDLSLVVEHEWPINCVALPLTNATTDGVYPLYSRECVVYPSNFLCETISEQVPGMRVLGGRRQRGNFSPGGCKASCRGSCHAADFDTNTGNCYHHYEEASCKPGHGAPGYIHIRKRSCDCNRYLLSGIEEVPTITASTVSGRDQLDGPECVVFDPTVPDQDEPPCVWTVPAAEGNGSWIQVKFNSAREIYGIVSRGRRSTDSAWVETYNVKYSVDCIHFRSIQANAFTANTDPITNAYTELPRAVYANCVRLFPVTWHNMVALRLEFLGCTGRRRNLALGQPAQQRSSVWSWWGRLNPELAADGYLDSRYYMAGQRRCAVVGWSSLPWWSIDIGARYDVTSVVITNREDCCSMYSYVLDGVTVRVADQSNLANNEDILTLPLCGTRSSTGLGESATIVCDPAVRGRFVYVYIFRHHYTYMLLCEVEVYGIHANETNAAVHKEASQSTTLPGHAAGNAVNGNADTTFTDGSCSATTVQDNPWWEVNLKNSYVIDSISITNRGDDDKSLRKIAIEVWDAPRSDLAISMKSYTPSRLCEYVKDPLRKSETRRVYCASKLTGHRVRITIFGAKEQLSLCEVQVFGEIEQIATFLGTGNSLPCVIPFFYNGTLREVCLTEGSKRPWCATTANYTRDGLWGYCQNVRLRDGRDEREGLVEFRQHQSWGEVCDDDWDDKDATVVCQQLGFDGGVAVFPPVFGSDFGREILLDDVQCNGTEEALDDCPATTGDQHDCSHEEDAGVQCYRASDRFAMAGYPAIPRSTRDRWTDGIVVLGPAASVPESGTILSWHLYAVAAGEIWLQIWRPSSEDTMILIYEFYGEITGTGKQTMYVSDVNQTEPVHAGDLVGFSFTDVNPIGFDNSIFCQQHRTYHRKSAGDVKPGDSVKFTIKSTAECKVYSVNVRIRKQEITDLSDFAYYGSIYKLLDGTQVYSSATTECVRQLGPKATIAKIESYNEYSGVNTALLDLEKVDSYWLNGRLGNIPQNATYIQWGRCQPELGKDCLSLSYEAETSSFRWYTRACDEHLQILCERVINESMQVPPGKPSKQGSAQQTSSSSTVVTVIVVLVVLAVVVGLAVWWRRRAGGATGAGLLEKLSIHFRPASSGTKSGIDNPAYSDSKGLS